MGFLKQALTIVQRLSVQFERPTDYSQSLRCSALQCFNQYVGYLHFYYSNEMSKHENYSFLGQMLSGHAACMISYWSQRTFFFFGDDVLEAKLPALFWRRKHLMARRNLESSRQENTLLFLLLPPLSRSSFKSLRRRRRPTVLMASRPELSPFLLPR